MFAVNKHREKGCRYSGNDYKLHLDSVVHVGRQYLHLLKDHHLEVLCALSCHDLLEDCGMNYNDLVTLFKQFSSTGDATFFADCVYNVTNELGKNRKQRAEKTYPKIASCSYSTFVKICDRTANMRFGWFAQSDGMFSKYQQEHESFYKALDVHSEQFAPMWKELEILASW
jgi:hypothetical protein